MEGKPAHTDQLLSLTRKFNLAALLDVVLAASVCTVLGTAAYLGYIFLQLLDTASVAPFGARTIFFFGTNIAALATMVLATLPRIFILLTSSGRLARRLLLSLLLPMLLAVMIFMLPLGLYHLNNVGGRAAEVPAVAERTSQLLRDLLREFRNESFAFTAQLVPQLIDHMHNQSIVSAGYLLEQTVAQYGLHQAGILDSRGIFFMVEPHSERAGEFPEPNLSYRELSSLIALTRRPTETIGTDIKHYRFIAEREQNGADRQLFRALLPLGEFEIDGDPTGLLLLLEKKLPSELFTILNDIAESERKLSTLRSQSEGYNAFLLLLSLNAFALALSLSTTVATKSLGTLDRRLTLLSRNIDAVATDGGTPGADLRVPVEGGDEVSSLSSSFNTMSVRIAELIAELQSNSQFLEAVLNNLDAGVVVLGRDGKVLQSNAACTRLLDAAPSPGETLEQFAAQHEQCKRLAASVNSLADEENCEVSAAGKTLLVRASELPHTAGGGRIVVLSDISEPLAGQQLRAWNEALQRFLHEVKNPLQPLLLSAEMLQRRIWPKLADHRDAEFMSAKIAAIIDGINRIDRVTKSLRAFTSQRPREYSPVDVNKAASEAAERHSSDFVEMSLELADRLPRALFDRDFLARVLDNLILNAREAAQERGIQKISVIISSHAENGKIFMHIQDNAGGISREDIGDIFKPHISFRRGGSGLGLAHVKGMLAEAGGSVTAENIGAGTQFTVVLPQASAPGPL